MKNRRGFIAFSSILLVSAIVGIIVLSVSLNSISDAQISLSLNGKDKVINFVESCVQDALLTLNITGLLPSSITLPTGVCLITINSHVGNNWFFTTVGTLDGYTRSIYVESSRSTTVAITKWIDQ